MAQTWTYKAPTMSSDETAQEKQGYLIGGHVYVDEAGTTPIPVGSTVTAADGTTYYQTAQGGKAAAQLSGGAVASPAASNPYISDIYAQQTKAATDALTSAYDQNVLSAQAAKDSIAGTYTTAKNTAAAQSETQRHNFNEYANASGLNTGTGGQAQLAMGNQLQSNLGNLSTQQAKDTSNADLQISQLKVKYQSDIAAAVAEGKFQTAQALYSKMVQDESAARQQSQFDATMGYNKSNDQYSRDAAAAQASGDFSQMTKWGWTPQQISAATSADRAASAHQYSGGAAQQTYTDPTEIYSAMNTSADPTGWLVANAKKLGLSAAQVEGLKSGYTSWMVTSGRQSPTTGQVYGRINPDQLLSSIKSDAADFGFSSSSVQNQLSELLASGRIDTNDVAYILGQLGLK